MQIVIGKLITEAVEVLPSQVAYNSDDLHKLSKGNEKIRTRKQVNLYRQPLGSPGELPVKKFFHH